MEAARPRARARPATGWGEAAAGRSPLGLFLEKKGLFFEANGVDEASPADLASRDA